MAGLLRGVKKHANTNLSQYGVMRQIFVSSWLLVSFNTYPIYMKKIITTLFFTIIFFLVKSQQVDSAKTKSMCKFCIDGNKDSCTALINFLKSQEANKALDIESARIVAYWQDRLIMLNQVEAVKASGDSAKYKMAKMKYQQMPDVSVTKNYTFTGPPLILQKLEVSFYTYGDNKDWDTHLYATLRKNGQTVASLDCCNSGRPEGTNPGTEFRTRTFNGPFNIPVTGNISEEELANTSSFEIGIRANGNDNWEFFVYLKATFNDGSVRRWTYMSNPELHPLNSRHGDFPVIVLPLR